MRQTQTCLVAVALLATTARAQLPTHVARAVACCVRPAAKRLLDEFFNKEARRFKVGLDLGCVEGPAAVAAESWRSPPRADLSDSKWGLESGLPGGNQSSWCLQDVRSVERACS